MKISHISAVCRNIKNADSFYGELLGYSKVKDFSIEAELSEKIFSIPCRCHIMVYANGRDEVEVFIPESFPEKKNSFEHVCLEVDDTKSFLLACENAGIHINTIVKGEKNLTFIRDFDGNLFEIKEKMKA